MTNEERAALRHVTETLRNRTGNIHTLEIELQVKRLNAAGITATVAQIEAQLGYPIGEASRDELRGVIAALEAVYDATDTPTT